MQVLATEVIPAFVNPHAGNADAAAAYLVARSLATTDAERRYLSRRLDEVGGGG